MWEKFNLIIPIQIRWFDIDPLQHVNNSIYLTYLEIARLYYWKEVFNITKLEDINFIISEINIKYLYPARLNDRIAIGVRADEIKRSSFKFYYEVWEEDKQKLLIDSTSIQVIYDYKNLKVVPMPQFMKEAIENFEKSETKLYIKSF